MSKLSIRFWKTNFQEEKRESFNGKFGVNARFEGVGLQKSFWVKNATS